MYLEGGKTIRIGRKINEKTQKLERISSKTKEAVK
jgi:hypothetical protein